MLPKEIVEATGEYKNNSTRILVLILLFFSFGMVAAYIRLEARNNGKSDKDVIKCEEEKAALRSEIMGLRNELVIVRSEKDSMTKEIKYLWIDRTKSQEDTKIALKKIEDILNKKK